MCPTGYKKVDQYNCAESEYSSIQTITLRYCMNVMTLDLVLLRLVKIMFRIIDKVKE